MNFNGQSAEIPGYNLPVTQWTIPLVNAYRSPNSSVSLVFVDNTPSDSGLRHWEQSTVSSAHYQSTTINPANTPQLTHGQVNFKWDSGSSQFELCPYNGPGGLIIDGAMHQIPIECLTLTNAATTSSAINYFYAVSVDDDNITVSGAADDGFGKIKLQVSDSRGNPGDLLGIRCVNIGGAIQANVRDTGKVIDSTHITLINTSSAGMGTYTAGGNCWVFRLAATTTGHIASNNGVEIMSGSLGGHYTLVGIAYIGGSHAVSDVSPKCDVASWFNRRAKTCINTYTSDHTWTSTSAWGEPSTEIRCEFVTFDDAHENAKSWSINGMFSNNTGGGGTLVGAGFSAISSVPAAEIIGEKGSNAPLSVHGAVSGLTEDVHYITLLAKTLTGGTSTITGTTPPTTAEIQLWQ